MINSIIHGDCLEVMKDIPDKSIDMVLCDLPYECLECKWDKKVPLDLLWQDYRRILKLNGTIVLTAGQPFASELITLGKSWFRYEWIWVKNKAANFVNAHRRPMALHESILIFSPGTVPTNSRIRIRYNPQGLIKINKHINHKTQPKNRYETGFHNPSDKPFVQEYTGYPTTILNINKEVKQVHPTQKPLALGQYLIRTYTDPGDTVLDNACGSGTFPLAAKLEGRNFIGIEKEEKYVDIACKCMEKATRQKTYNNIYKCIDLAYRM